MAVKQSKPGRHLDPRTRLILGAMGVTAILMTGQSLLLAAALLLLCAGILFGGKAKPWFQALKMLLPLVGLVFIISVISFDAETALMLSLRLFDLLTLSFFFFHGLDPEDLGQSLRQMGIPYAFCFILTTSLRYVPFMGMRIRRIMDAQRSRGIDLRPGIRNIPNFAALLMPLLVQSFVLAEQLAMAMESRGFAREGRTLRREYRITWGEYAAMGVALGFLVGYGIWKESGGGKCPWF
ncbi:MAG: energy-coupling factor transporter transmembrane protein EcfT [Deltaproteobacteria bacterium]|nr:energy-coupling factor transporter transmembrane protein EcfT [Deltaproteobacteria bacterium]